MYIIYLINIHKHYKYNKNLIYSNFYFFFYLSFFDLKFSECNPR